MVAPAGQSCDQLPRENLVTRREAGSESASFSMARHLEALWRCAARACLMVQRNGSRGAGRLRCGAEFLSQLRRLLCRWAKMAARVRPSRGFFCVAVARQAAKVSSRTSRMSGTGLGGDFDFAALRGMAAI